MKTILTGLFLLVSFVFTWSFMGCGEDSDPAPISASMSMKVTTAPLSKTATDTVVLTQVKILLAEIELEGPETTDDDGDGDDDGEEIELGPFVVPLNLNGKLTTVAGAMIPNGTYDEIEFEIRKRDDDETINDDDFGTGNERYSMVVRGTYNDTAFVWKTSLDIEQELELNPPMVVNDSIGPSNVSILVNPFVWFYDNGLALDPRKESNRSKIENNIKSGFKAFKDNDKDGDDNDDDDDD